MRYADGQIAMLGDELDLGGEMTGIVVACLDERQFTPEFPESRWGVLELGVLVNSEQAGIIHRPEPDGHVILIRRHQ
jgi:hypothetical protein